MTVEDDPFFREPSLKRPRHARPVPIDIAAERRDDTSSRRHSDNSSIFGVHLLPANPASTPGALGVPAGAPTQSMHVTDSSTGEPHVPVEDEPPAVASAMAPSRASASRSSGSRRGKRRAPPKPAARRGSRHRAPAGPVPRGESGPQAIVVPRKRRRARRRKQQPFVYELPRIIGTALVISILIKTFLVQAFYIPTGSMENTLLVDDRVLVNKLVDRADEIKRGYVIVFRDPGGWLTPGPPAKGGIGGAIREALVFVGLAPAVGDEDLIKRVIGIGGDKVACCDSKGRVTVNGVALDEPYLYPGNVPSLTSFEVVVPKDKLWVMGDHRAASKDSREHQQQPGMSGFVPVDDVIGRAGIIVWPLSRAGKLSRPDTFEQDKLQTSRNRP